MLGVLQVFLLSLLCLGGCVQANFTASYTGSLLVPTEEVDRRGHALYRFLASPSSPFRGIELLGRLEYHQMSTLYAYTGELLDRKNSCITEVSLIGHRVYRGVIRSCESGFLKFAISIAENDTPYDAEVYFVGDDPNTNEALARALDQLLPGCGEVIIKILPEELKNGDQVVFFARKNNPKNFILKAKNDPGLLLEVRFLLTTLEVILKELKVYVGPALEASSSGSEAVPVLGQQASQGSVGNQIAQ